MFYEMLFDYEIIALPTDGVLLALRTGLNLVGHNEPSCCGILDPTP